jgi:hypothetical protein
MNTPSVVSSTQVNLSWSASADAESGIANYELERCTGAACTTFIQIATPTGTTRNDTGLTANTTYRYRVRAKNGAGLFSGYSNIVSATTPAGQPGCIESSASWQNNSFAAQSSPFTATYDDTPNAAAMDGVTGLSLNAAVDYTSLAVITRFNNTGTIDARNGGAYETVTAVPYTPGTTYHFRLVVNPSAQTYSAYVTPAGGSEIQIANNYAFRTEQAGTNSLNNWALTSSLGTHTVCNFTIAGGGTKSADLNADGIVNSLDWSIMNAAWGTNNATADLNSDGIVDSFDWSVMNGRWGTAG